MKVIVYVVYATYPENGEWYRDCVTGIRENAEKRASILHEKGIEAVVRREVYEI